VRYLTLAEAIELHRLVIAQAGGATGVRDLGALESALALPRATFAGTDLYPGIADKASALGYSLALNHPFVDGNKRVAHAALETFLMLNGHELAASIDDAEQTMLSLAAGEMSRDAFTSWVTNRLTLLP
jgi:death on curing protein